VRRPRRAEAVVVGHEVDGDRRAEVGDDAGLLDFFERGGGHAQSVGADFLRFVHIGGDRRVDVPADDEQGGDGLRPAE
jgi:hypothetical protein